MNGMVVATSVGLRVYLCGRRPTSHVVAAVFTFRRSYATEQYTIVSGHVTSNSSKAPLPSLTRTAAVSSRGSAHNVSQPSAAVRATSAPTTEISAQSGGLLAKLQGYAQKSREMMKQFFVGTKVFLEETRQAKELKRRKVVNGYEWTRKEYFLVKRNEQDFWRAIPFLLCCVLLSEAIPFLLIRGIVPSPCLTETQLDARWKRLQEIRQKLAKDAVQSVNVGQAVRESNVQASQFLQDDFVKHIANTQPQYFLLEGMNRSQLKSINTYLGIWRFGPAPYLRRVLRQHCDYIQGDDMLLKKEGLDLLTSQELKWAVEARGLPSTGATPTQMRSDLSSWVNLHTVEKPKIPTELMFFTTIVRTGLVAHASQKGDGHS
ncbi:hypothetical protein HDU85_003808 [Gaertneriomyces sp. JEL0708]|nr:hypothetical protein HDU85_003808 [Gaertneriomyces sp. JEL0708]